MVLINNQIIYFYEKGCLLAGAYEVQISRLSSLGDYLTEDIANDWIIEDIKVLNELVEKKLISEKAVELYSMIYSNFIEVSSSGQSFEKDIWTLNALKNHMFWEKQRDLAKQFLKELNM